MADGSNGDAFGIRLGQQADQLRVLHTTLVGTLRNEMQLEISKGLQCRSSPTQKEKNKHLWEVECCTVASWQEDGTTE